MSVFDVRDSSTIRTDFRTPKLVNETLRQLVEQRAESVARTSPTTKGRDGLVAEWWVVGSWRWTSRGVLTIM